MKMETVQGERFRRLVTLTVTLDVAGWPARASVVDAILDNHGKQPLETGMQAFGGDPDTVELTPEVLSAIADLYGVDRAYLADIGSDPSRDLRISEELYERRIQSPSPGYNVRLDGALPLPAIHEPILEQVDVVTQLARRKMWSIIAWPAVAGLLLLALTALFGLGAVTGDSGVVGGGWIRVFMGGASLLLGATAVQCALFSVRALRLVRVDREAFGAAIHTALRAHIASKLYHYMTTTDLPYDFFTATIGHELPVENGTLERLARGDRDRKASIIQDAVAAYLF